MQSDLASDAVEQLMTGVFARVESERMRGLPINNPDLSVQIVGVRQFGGDWFGALITPWCMNLLVVPLAGSPTRIGLTGDKSWIPLPGGEIEFIASTEDGVPPFAACSLFSPMGGFDSQELAVETAESIVQALFEPEDVPADAVGNGRDATRDSAGMGLTRRELLLGLRRSRS